MAIAIDESLQLWSDIKDQFHSGGILLGNGSSCAVWEKFNYSSLYKKACHGIEHPLSEENQALFKSMKTENFEGVLAALATAKMVNRLNGEETVPLFVAEGNAEDKLSTIKSSDYLSFAYGEFAKHKGSLVIFGHGLGESDQHILDAIRKAKPGKIAISIRGQTPPEDIKCRKAELQKKLSGSINPKNLIFFCAETHPLGSPEINVNVN